MGPSHARHLHLDRPGLVGQIVDDGIEELVGAVDVGRDGLDGGQQRLHLGPLGPDLVKEAGVVRLDRLELGVELRLLRRQLGR